MPGFAAKFRDDPGAPNSRQREHARRPHPRYRQALRQRIRVALQGSVGSFAEITPQLAPALRDGKYTGVLWDDTAGRLPGIVYHELASLVAYDRGVPIPFGAGVLAGKTERANSTRASTSEEVADAVAVVSQDLGPSVLLVTERMFDGDALRRITSSLRARRKVYDVLITDWSYREHQMRGSFPDIVTDDNGYYRSSTPYGTPSAWEIPDLVAARGVDINLSGPKTRRNAWLDLPRVDDELAYFPQRHPDLTPAQHAFVADDVRVQLTTIAATLHRVAVRGGVTAPHRIADAVTKALDTHISRKGRKTARSP